MSLAMTGIKDYAIIILDVDGFVTCWNEGAQQIKGYSADEIIGKHFSLFYPREEIDNGKPALELELATARGRFEDEGWRLRKDGSRFFASVLISPLVESSGKLRGFVKVTRDITTRRAHECQVNDLKQRLSLALDVGEVGVWDYDLLSRRTWRSVKLDQILGLKTQSPEWHSDSLLSYIVHEDRSYAKEVFKNALKIGHYSVECKILRSDNVTRWISSKGEIVKDANGKAVRMVGTVVDITDRVERENHERTLAIMKEREDFITTLTHDMKNPLIGASSLLESFIAGHCGELTDAQVEMLQCLQESNQSLLNLIRNVIDLYRFEKDAKTLVLEDADLQTLIGTAVRNIAPIARMRGINLTTELPTEADTILIDNNAISRVLRNLLDNAVKFAPDNGNVSVRLLCGHSESIVEVEDDGPGIALDERLHLFKRFSQGATGRRYACGTGLGLYLCKQIMEAHGGHIELISRANKAGTIFQFRMPRNKIRDQTSVA
jgi:PAS domain S-box-containing protein